jgi:hypothetical protein
MRLLYLSKQVRLDIISVVFFLCTRVKRPTEEDLNQLWRVLGYLKGTRDWMMKMRPKNVFWVVVYINGSFSAHPDGKSHSEVVVRVGGVSVFLAIRSRNA